MDGTVLRKLSILDRIGETYPDAKERELAYALYGAFIEIEATAFGGTWINWGVLLGIPLACLIWFIEYLLFGKVYQPSNDYLFLATGALPFLLGMVIVRKFWAKPRREKAINELRHGLLDEKGKGVLETLKRFDPAMNHYLRRVL
jgi:hypothetical protein